MKLVSFLTILQLRQFQVQNQQNFHELFQNTEIKNDTLCQVQMGHILDGLKRTEEWAEYVMDAWGSFPSGIYSGNLYDFGSFDQCLKFQHDTQIPEIGVIQGQHCTLMIPFNQKTENRSLRFIPPIDKSKIELKIGICIPATCSDLQVKEFANKMLEKINLTTSNSYKQKDYCTTRDERNFPFKPLQIFAIVIFAVFFLLMILSTIYDVICIRNKNITQSPTLTSFSMLANSKKIFSLQPSSTKEIKCLHGIRALSVIWIVICHNYLVTYWQEPLINGLDLVEWFKQFASMTILSGEMGVDTFFLLSGFLLTTSILGQLEREKKINVLNLYIRRYLRITPAFAAAILFTVSFLYYIGNGPIWTVTKYSAIGFCEKYWWSSLLFIQNYYNAGNLCFGHSWYLMVDMQLYFLAPIILYPLWKYREKFLPVIVLLTLGVMGCTFAVFLRNGFWVGFHRENLKHTKLIYTSTHIRMSSWLIGVLFGYLMFKTSGRRLKLSRSILIVGWIFSICAIFGIVFGQYNLQQFNYNPVSNIGDATFEALRRVLWSIAVAWIIMACINGYGGVINKFLSLPFWMPISKLSYTIYLIHLPLQLVMLASIKAPEYFSDFRAIHKFYGDFGLTFLISWLWSLAFEFPIINLTTIFLRK